jgi:hypothetical protein
MPALAMRFNVFTGVVDIAIPATLTSELVKLGHARDIDSIPIDVKINYQACDDTMCLQPKTMLMRFDAPIGDVILPEGIAVYVDRVLKESKKP